MGFFLFPLKLNYKSLCAPPPADEQGLDIVIYKKLYVFDFLWG